MAISKSKSLNLTLFLLSTLIFAFVESQTFPPVHTILVQNGLGPGLFPDAAHKYNFTNGKLEVEVTADICIVYHPSSIIRYERKLSGKLSYAKLEDVRGIQLLQAFGWVPVTLIECIAVTMKFYLSPLGSMPVLLPAVEFKDIPPCTRPGTVKDGVSEDNRGVAASI